MQWLRCDFFCFETSIKHVIIIISHKQHTPKKKISSIRNKGVFVQEINTRIFLFFRYYRQKKTMYANVIIACKRKLSAVSNFDSFLNGFYNFRLKIKITQSKVLKQANKFDVMVSVVDSYQNWLLFKFKLNHKQNHINVKMNTQKKPTATTTTIEFDLPHCSHQFRTAQSCVCLRF